MMYGYMHINEIASIHLAAVENLFIKEESGVEETLLNPVPLVCFIDETIPPKHKIFLHHPRADVYYSSIGVKCCRHMFLAATGGYYHCSG